MAYNSNLMKALDAKDRNTLWNIVYNSAELVPHTAEYDPKWNNGTGYLDGAIRAELPEVPMYGVARSCTPLPNNRRILLVKTQFGNVVIFERYTPDEPDVICGPLIVQMPDEVQESEMIGCASVLSADNLINAVGDGDTLVNVALRLDRFAKTLREGSERSKRHEAFLAKE